METDVREHFTTQGGCFESFSKRTFEAHLEHSRKLAFERVLKGRRIENQITRN